MSTEQHFKEVETIEQANKVDITVWSFIGIREDKFAFKRRVRK